MLEKGPGRGRRRPCRFPFPYLTFVVHVPYMCHKRVQSMQIHGINLPLGYCSPNIQSGDEERHNVCLQWDCETILHLWTSVGETQSN